MSLLSVGAHCVQENCKQVDFLPILCHCDKYFCRDHIQTDSHACTVAVDTIVVPDPNHKSSLSKCTVAGCNKLGLDAFASDKTRKISALCPACSQSFCVDHRHPVSHSCKPQESSIAPLSGRNETARALLTKNFSKPAEAAPGPSRRPSKVPTDPAKLAQYKKLELMKMRHSAKSLDAKDNGVAPEERLHIKVHVEPKDKVFWCRKTISAGKALDLLSAQLGKGTQPSNLHVEGEETPLNYGEPIGNQIEDGQVVELR